MPTLTESMLTALRIGLSHPCNLVYAGSNGYGRTVPATVIKALASRGLVDLLPAKNGDIAGRGVVGRVTAAGAEAAK